MLNPVRMRIIQELASRQSLTATELCEKISDVPRTTMYRHIGVLLDNGIVSVVSEKKIRGSLERSLALNVGEITRNNSLENASQKALGFLMNRYARFHKYFSGANPDPGRDKIFFNTTVLLMDDEEFEQFLSELQGLLGKYSLGAAEGRRPRDISVISTPAEGD
jgi:DNA-binding transcriptional ArsR family regulator